MRDGRAGTCAVHAGTADADPDALHLDAARTRTAGTAGTACADASCADAALAEPVDAADDGRTHAAAVVHGARAAGTDADAGTERDPVDATAC